jgi:DNA-binding HxlR family transcriptional regulator
MKRTMAVLGTKWKPIIVYALRDHTARFGQIAAVVGEISRKVLTTTLKELEADGIITRSVHKEVPPRVDYSLTEKGLALLPIMYQLAAWEEEFSVVKDMPKTHQGKQVRRSKRFAKITAE